MMLKRVIALILLPLLTIICNPISSIQPGVPSSSNHPLDVQVTLDSEHYVTQTITPDGGTLEATAQDGTHYTLTIPKDALLDAVDITMTPVKGMENLPLSNKSLAAVQLAPEGLNLLQPATLVIKAATPIPVKELVSFAYLGEGKDVHLFPLDGNPAEMTFQIMHFSGYGTGQGNSSDLQKYPPGSGESSAEAQGTDIMKGVQDHGGGVSDEDKTKLCKVILDWYNASVIGDLKAAETDSSSLYAAGGQFMRWLYKSQLFSCEHEAEIEEGKQSLAKGMEHAYHEAAPKCDVKLMYQWSKWAALLGLLSYAPDLTWDPNVKEDIEKCQKFTMDIGGTLTLPGAVPISFTVTQGTVSLKRTGPGTFYGEIDLAGEFEGVPKECSISDQPKWHFTVGATNSDEYVHQGSIFDINVTMTMAWAGKGSCPDVSVPFSNGEGIPIPSFQMPAQDGAHYDYKNGGFTEGSIVFTFHDPDGYLEKVGTANWQSR